MRHNLQKKTCVRGIKHSCKRQLLCDWENARKEPLEPCDETVKLSSLQWHHQLPGCARVGWSLVDAEAAARSKDNNGRISDLKPPIKDIPPLTALLDAALRREIILRPAVRHPQDGVWTRCRNALAPIELRSPRHPWAKSDDLLNDDDLGKDDSVLLTVVHRFRPEACQHPSQRHVYAAVSRRTVHKCWATLPRFPPHREGIEEDMADSHVFECKFCGLEQGPKLGHISLVGKGLRRGFFVRGTFALLWNERQNLENTSMP